jgi:hypothetical protein
LAIAAVPVRRGTHRGSNSAASQQEKGGKIYEQHTNTYGIVVSDAPEDSDKKAQWFEIAKVWTHKDKDGFDVVLPPGVTVSGCIIVRRNKAKAD